MAAIPPGEQWTPQLHADIQAGIDQLDHGESFDAEEVYAEARRRIKAIESQQS